MRINNNIMAMNTHRQYNINNNNIAKSTEKLSSGYRINRAGDDAAGLAISEKMRAQIRGLTMASKNSQDAVSLIQTAEGALQSTHDILQRMRELAVQSASDTNETTIDRGALQQEFAALLAEIDDTASKTRFNDQNLIDGTFAALKRAISQTTSTFEGSVAVGNANAGTYTMGVKQINVGYVLAGDATGTESYNSLNTNIADMTFVGGTNLENTAGYNGDWELKWDDSQGQFYLNMGDRNIYGSVDLSAGIAAGDDLVIDFGNFGELTIETGAGTSLSANASAAVLKTWAEGFTDGSTIVSVADGVNYNPGTYKFYATMDGATDVELKAGDNAISFDNGITIYLNSAISAADLTAETVADANGNASPLNGDFDIDRMNGTFEVTVWAGKSLVVQTGANQGDELSINIDKMDSNYLGIAASSIGTREHASLAITQVNKAINQVSTQRAALGALQNRLDYKIANLDTSAENLTAAESRIRDVDMAKEMTTFTKNNILFQASMAMLAQANAAPQGVLQLLQ